MSRSIFLRLQSLIEICLHTSSFLSSRCFSLFPERKEKGFGKDNPPAAWGGASLGLATRKLVLAKDVWGPKAGLLARFFDSMIGLELSKELNLDNYFRTEQGQLWQFVAERNVWSRWQAPEIYACQMLDKLNYV